MSSEASQVQLSSVSFDVAKKEEAASKAPSDRELDDDKQQQQYVILFYKYHPLSSSYEIMEPFRLALEHLCTSLCLIGRILVGCSDHSEGINGTLAGSQPDIQSFMVALLGPDNNNAKKDLLKEISMEESQLRVIQQFWKENNAFAACAHVPPLYMESLEDFKVSSSSASAGGPLFPDLNIKLVKELIGTGGLFSSISIEETSRGYLTPTEWHEELLSPGEDTIVIDCRNTKECSIGHFEGSLDPKVTTFAQFPHWVKQNKCLLQNKKILMSCTGGIRCEKASAFIRREVQNVKEVKHLKGGVHKYLEQYGNDGLWRGKNFVFDGRGAASPNETKQLGTKRELQPTSSETTRSGEEDIVGQCIYCQCPYDTYDPSCVCTVCREPSLVCTLCRTRVSEFHCGNHWHLRNCYFTDLENFSAQELQQQLNELQSHFETISVGRRYKQKRKTLQKQCRKIQAFLEVMDGKNKEEGVPDFASNTTKCRSCGDVACGGSCWGYHGLKRKEVLEKEKQKVSSECHNTPKNKRSRAPLQQSKNRVSKVMQRQHDVEEIQRLHLCLPPSAHCDLDTGIRVPPPCTRVLQTSVKGKWCGKPARSVVQQEFVELSNDSVLSDVLDKGLLRVNGEPLTHATAHRELKNMDVISRIVHWHEAPVQVPPKIVVTKVQVPANVCEEYRIIPVDGDAETPMIYVCDKPSSVPVHPAGPYLSNSLTLMVEAQEQLNLRTLMPCHRIDRATSGLTLCCTNVGVARLVQSQIDKGDVMKLYLAAVEGHFPQAESDLELPNRDTGMWSWCHGANCVEVDAPVESMDARNGIRAVSSTGKPSRSRFRFLAHDVQSNTSIVACRPITGRGHQLRVHLQWLGFPICNDTQYDGKIMEDNTRRPTKEAVICQMMASIDKEVIDFNDGALPREESRLAKEACCCCRDGQKGIESSFSPAQLLQSGHSIRLHALRYRIPIRRKKKGTDKNKSLEAPLAVIDMEVEMPDWAKCFGDLEVPWLQDASYKWTMI